jgi:hypothetical protein
MAPVRTTRRRGDFESVTSDERTETSVLARLRLVTRPSHSTRHRLYCTVRLNPALWVSEPEVSRDPNRIGPGRCAGRSARCPPADARTPGKDQQKPDRATSVSERAHETIQGHLGLW